MRPIFTIHAGEYLAATEIEKRFRHLQVWIPSKDTGIDLLVTDGRQNKVACLQVKFSKDYLGSSGGAAQGPEIASSGWWTFQRTKIAKSAADFWVLTLYQFQSRKFDFVIVRPDELLARTVPSTTSPVWRLTSSKPSVAARCRSRRRTRVPCWAS